MIEETGAITWNQLIGVSSAITMVSTGAIGYVLRAIGQQGKRIDSMAKDIQAHQVKVAEEYATTDVVVQIEGRLTESINRMSEQLTSSISHLTSRFEELFTKVVDAAVRRP